MATIVQRGERWQAKIRRDGYPEQSKSFETRRDAAEWARAEEREMDRGAWRDRSAADSTTLYSLLDRYLKDVVPAKKGADVEKLRIATLQRDKLSKYKLSALSPLVLAEWRDRRIEAGCQGATVRREMDVISAVMNWARRELMIAVENPIAAIKRPAPSKARGRRLEDGEETRLLTALEDHGGESEREDGKKYRRGSRNPWIRPVVLFALETAMRRGEILALEWKNVDLKRRTAYLPDTKNGESRTVPMSSRAVAVLEGLLEIQDGVKVLPAGKVFKTTADAIKKAWERACKTAGLEDLHFHDLRHEATSRLAERLPNVIELAAVTGHKDLQMLKRYYHPRAEDLAKKLG